LPIIEEFKISATFDPNINLSFDEKQRKDTFAEGGKFYSSIDVDEDEKYESDYSTYILNESIYVENMRKTAIVYSYELQEESFIKMQSNSEEPS
jgi:hypothetical protein